ncbi:MAG: hypothetical protein WAU50_12120 [Candidatus Sulfotelmatobacter sp.]
MSGRQGGSYPETAFKEVNRIGTDKSACKKRSRLLPTDDLAGNILRGVASFPHFMGSHAPKIMEDFSDILRRFALALALGADFLSIQCRGKVALCIGAVAAGELA